MYEKRNAKITGVEITIADHGVLTIWVSLQWPNGGQAFGGFSLGKKMDDMNLCGYFITRLLETMDEWTVDALIGKVCQIEHNHSEVYAIVNILDSEKRFCPKEEWAHIRGEA